MRSKLVGKGLALMAAMLAMVCSLAATPQVAKAQTGNFAFIGFEFDFGDLDRYDHLQGGQDTAMDIYWHTIGGNGPWLRWVYVKLYASIAYKNSGGSTLATGDVFIDLHCPWSDGNNGPDPDGICFGLYMGQGLDADRHWILDYAYDTIQANGSLSTCTQVTVTYYVKLIMDWEDDQHVGHSSIVDVDYISGSWSGAPWPYFP
jgi:hypothetical protein